MHAAHAGEDGGDRAPVSPGHAEDEARLHERRQYHPSHEERERDADAAIARVSPLPRREYSIAANSPATTKNVGMRNRWILNTSGSFSADVCAALYGHAAPIQVTVKLMAECRTMPSSIIEPRSASSA